ncbi:hypothetical protein [Aquimarina sp. I32.4]|uniref:hypothetical protein n=1 Tax=Aquimarina sp. I32.4 TaxID=2053903 RepID=UPI001304E852|nr:hypothetical protein [Aquimarina sp. I32.4]
MIEAILYNLKEEIYKGKETIVWTGQSSLIDPSSIESAASSFTNKMVHHLVNDSILKK